MVGDYKPICGLAAIEYGSCMPPTRKNTQNRVFFPGNQINKV